MIVLSLPVVLALLAVLYISISAEERKRNRDEWAFAEYQAREEKKQEESDNARQTAMARACIERANARKAGAK